MGSFFVRHSTLQQQPVMAVPVPHTHLWRLLIWQLARWRFLERVRYSMGLPAEPDGVPIGPELPLHFHLRINEVNQTTQSILLAAMLAASRFAAAQIQRCLQRALK